MHISEGVLNAPVLLGGAAVAALGTAIGIRKIDYETLPQVALLSAAFFTASLVRVPLGPVSAHLVLNGMCGLLLGWAAFPAIFVGLTLQALLFQHGGITTLGANTMNIALPAVFLGLLARKTIASERRWVRTVGEFACGAGAIFCTGLMVAGSLVATGEAFASAAGLIAVAHIPVMVVEGLLTVLVVEFLRRVRPEMLGFRLQS